MVLIYVKGVAHPPTTVGNDDPFLDFRPDEMEDAVDKYKNVKVYYEHKKELGVIGEVRRLEHEPGGPLIAHMLISDQSVGGKLAVDGIRSGRVGSMSLGQAVLNSDWMDIGRVKGFAPTEISVCAKPGREGSDFLEVSFGDGKLYRAEKTETGARTSYREIPATKNIFTNLIARRNQQASQPRDRKREHSRMSDAIGTSSVTASAGNAVETWEAKRQRLGLTEEELNRHFSVLEEEINQRHAQIAAQICASLPQTDGISPEDVKKLPYAAAVVCAALDNTYKRAQSALKARYEEVEAQKKQRDMEVAALKANLEKAEAERQLLVKKLGAQSQVALSSAEERFVAPTVVARDESSQPSRSADVGVSPVEVTASYGDGGAGLFSAIAVKRDMPSIFDPVYAARAVVSSSTSPFDYKRVLESTKAFNRNHIALKE